MELRERAEPAGRRAPAGTPVIDATTLDRAVSAFRVSLDVAQALPLVESVLGAFPDFVPAHLLLFEINEFLNDEDACQEILGTLQTRAGNFDDAGRLQAAAIGFLRRDRDPRSALAAIRKHNRSFPFVPMLSWPEIEARLGTGEVERGREMVGNLVRQRPRDALYRWYAARHFLVLGSPENARGALDRSAEEPGWEWLHLPAARLALDAGDVAGARRHVDLLRNTPHSHPGILECDVQVALAEGNLEAAFRTARERVSLAGEGLEKARAYSSLARLARTMGTAEDAERWEEIAQRLRGSVAGASAPAGLLRRGLQP